MKNWKNSDINTDSLWVINERDKMSVFLNFTKGLLNVS
jgi:hypothetical protein